MKFLTQVFAVLGLAGSLLSSNAAAPGPYIGATPVVSRADFNTNNTAVFNAAMNIAQTVTANSNGNWIASKNGVGFNLSVSNAFNQTNAAIGGSSLDNYHRMEDTNGLFRELWSFGNNNGATLYSWDLDVTTNVWSISYHGGGATPLSLFRNGQTAMGVAGKNQTNNGNVIMNGGVTMPTLTASRPLVLNSFGNPTNATGTPDGTKFLRDDGVLATPAGSSGFPLTANANAAGFQVTNLWGIGFSNSASMTAATTDKSIVVDATHVDVNGEGRFNTIVATGGVSSVSSLTPGILVLSSTNPANVGFSVPTNSTLNYTNVYKGAFPFAPGHCWVVETTNGNFIVWTNGPCPGGSSASVGGAKPQVQFNNGGSLSGTTNMTWDETNSALTITPPSGAPTNNIGPTTITGGAQVTTTFAVGPGASQSESLGVGGNGDFTGWTISTQSLTRMNLFLLATNANTLGVSNILVTPFNSQYVDLHATNALTWTNYANFASTNAGYAAWRVAPEVINRTNLWLLGKGSGVNILTNIGLPLYPTFTNGISYMVEFSWWGTNILVSTKAISQ